MRCKRTYVVVEGFTARSRRVERVPVGVVVWGDGVVSFGSHSQGSISDGARARDSLRHEGSGCSDKEIYGTLEYDTIYIAYGTNDDGV